MINEREIVRRVYWDYRSAARFMAPRFTPRGWYECDVMIVMRSGLMLELEIKTSRSDFRADARKSEFAPGFRLENERPAIITKHERLAARDTQGPSRFAFIVPEGLIEPSEVPSWAGLLVARDLGSGRCVILPRKAPPRLHRVKCDADALERLVMGRIYHRFWQKYAGEVEPMADGVPG